MWKNQGSWNSFHAKLIPNSSNVYEKRVQDSMKPYNRNSRIEFFNPTVLVFVIKKLKVIEQSYHSLL